MPPIPPRQYQAEGITFLASRDTALLGDDTGLGKSMQVILAADLRGYKRILVVCPSAGRISWPIQFKTWATIPRIVFTYPEQTGGIIPSGPCVLVVNYEWLSMDANTKALKAALRAADPFDLLVVDEAHFLKTFNTHRTRAVYGRRLDFQDSIGERCRARWIMTATFTPNNASEIYTHLRAALPDVLAAMFGGRMPLPQQFTARFCDTVKTPWGLKIKGNNRHEIPKLGAAIRPFLLSRKKKDVAPELGTIQFMNLPVEPDLSRVDISEGQELDQEILSALSVDPDLDPDSFLEELKKLSMENSHVSTRRSQLGISKVPGCVAWIVNFLGNNPGKKLVVFAYHKDVIEALRSHPDVQHFNPVSIRGDTPQGDRAAAVDRFQNLNSTRLFVGQIVSAGTSITLTAASDVLVVEPDWTPVNNYQAVSRVHRIGQTEPVFAYFAYAAGTMDAQIARVLRRKAEDNAQLFGGDALCVV